MKERPDALEKAALTRREFDVVEQLLNGATAIEVASTLRLSFHTVRTHIRNVYEKLGVANRIELVNRLKRATNCELACHRRLSSFVRINELDTRS